MTEFRADDFPDVEDTQDAHKLRSIMSRLKDLKEWNSLTPGCRECDNSITNQKMIQEIIDEFEGKK